MRTLSAIAVMISLIFEWSAPALASTRMEQDVSDLMNQSANAIQVALDRKVYEVKNPEALLFKTLEKGLDAIETESRHQSPQQLSQTIVELTGDSPNLLMPNEIANAFQQTRSELRLQVAREVAEIHAQDPRANAVVKYLARTQQKLLNREFSHGSKKVFKYFGAVLVAFVLPLALSYGLFALGWVSATTACTIAVVLIFGILIWQGLVHQRYVREGRTRSVVDLNHQNAPWWVIPLFDEYDQMEWVKFRDAQNTIFIDFEQLRFQRNQLTAEEKERKGIEFQSRLNELIERLQTLHRQKPEWASEWGNEGRIQIISSYSSMIRAQDIAIRIQSGVSRATACQELLLLRKDTLSADNRESGQGSYNYPLGLLPINQRALLPQTYEGVESPVTTFENVYKFIDESMQAMGGCK